MDRIGEEGVIFENAMTTNPETLPSHASIFTGQWPHRHGVRANAGFILPDAELTLADTGKNDRFAGGLADFPLRIFINNAVRKGTD